MRTPVIAANWKMHKTVAEAEEFVAALLPVGATAERVAAAGSHTRLPALLTTLPHRVDGRQQVSGEAGDGQQYGDCEREGEPPPAHQLEGSRSPELYQASTTR